MPLSPRRWRARHLFGAWIAYWVALLVVVLGPAALAAWRIRNAGPDTSSASFSFGDKGLEAKIVSLGATLWAGSASVGETILALVGPPLLLAFFWIALRPRASAAPPPAALPREPLDESLDESILRQRQGTRERGRGV